MTQHDLIVLSRYANSARRSCLPLVASPPMTSTTAARLLTGLSLLFPAAAAMASLPVAHCRKGDRVETGITGWTTPEEIASGKAA